MLVYFSVSVLVLLDKHLIFPARLSMCLCIFQYQSFWTNTPSARSDYLCACVYFSISPFGQRPRSARLYYVCACVAGYNACLSFSISPFGQTPRSARSDHNVKSIEDEIDEEIDEDLSVAEDLLKSDNSLVSIRLLSTRVPCLQMVHERDIQWQNLVAGQQTKLMFVFYNVDLNPIVPFFGFR